MWMSRGVEKVELTGQCSWSIFLLGWGGIFAVMGMKRYGRLPVLFWSQVSPIMSSVVQAGSDDPRAIATFLGLPRRVHFRSQLGNIWRDALSGGILWVRLKLLSRYGMS